jgi:hypothetical protein
VLVVGSLLFTRGSRLEVNASMQPHTLTSDEAFKVHAQLSNVGTVTVQLHDPTCEPLQIRVSNSMNQAIWETHSACPLMFTPGVIELKPGQSLSTTECMHYVNGAGSCAGYYPSLPVGHYRLSGTFYGQPFSSLAFDVVGPNTAR